MPDPQIPAAGKERDAWVEWAVRVNNVFLETSSIESLTTVICQLLPERDDMDAFHRELAKIRDVERLEAPVLVTISTYAYCPEFKPKLTEDNFKAPGKKRIVLDQ
ncbi:hypothetical protein [Arthrobacter sp. UYCo732]|uniref:hypothetical protein n=1 Tax=Arthrobacter sp. UYCo732 TaxID=3156336 RepID=UPI00339A4EB0